MLARQSALIVIIMCFVSSCTEGSRTHAVSQSPRAMDVRSGDDVAGISEYTTTGWTLSMRVIDADTRAPASRATLWCLKSDLDLGDSRWSMNERGDPVPEALAHSGRMYIADDRGEVTVTFAGKDDLLVARDGNRWSNFLDLIACFKEREIAVQQHSAVRLRAIDPSGRPVPGLRVRVEDMAGHSGSLAFDESLTNEDGLAWFYIASPMERPHRARPVGLSIDQIGIGFSPAMNGTTQITLPVPFTRSVGVRIVDESGCQIPGMVSVASGPWRKSCPESIAIFPHIIEGADSPAQVSATFFNELFDFTLAHQSIGPDGIATLRVPVLPLVVFGKLNGAPPKRSSVFARTLTPHPSHPWIINCSFPPWSPVTLIAAHPLQVQLTHDGSFSIMLPEQLRELPECSAVILFNDDQGDNPLGAEFSFVPTAARTLDVGIVAVSRGPIVVAGQIHGVDGPLETVSVELGEAHEPWHGFHSTAIEWSSTGFSIRGWPIYLNTNAKGQPLEPTLTVRAHGFEPVTIPFKLGTTNLSVTLSPIQR